MTESKESREQLTTELASNLVGILLLDHSIRTKPVEKAFRSVPRHLFVDRYYNKDRLVKVDAQNPTPAQLRRIYSNSALVSHRRRRVPTSSTSQPSLVAQMLEQLLLEPGQRVLEIGAGTGWNAALMGHIVGADGHVYGVDIQEDVAQRARNHIQRLGAKNVEIITGDGGYGYPQAAPYDRIITTANCPEISPHWMEQLVEGGALLISLRDMEGSSWCLLMRLWKRKDHLSGEVISTPGFMTLQGKYGAAVVQSSAEERLDVIKAGRRPRSKAVPLAKVCPDPNFRRWVLDHLVFFTYLEGMSIERVGMRYALRSKGSESVCVTDHEKTEIYGSDAAYETLEEIARKWVQLGAPWRTHYLVEVWPLNVSKRKPKNGWLVQREHTQLIFRLKKEYTR
jgi:protein-L-isoaspartate(D-aspartate) O-methyltransferase